MLNLFTGKETEVAGILLELSTSVSDTEAARSFTLSWAMRKPRSLRERKPSKSSSSLAVSSVFRSLSPPPSVSPTADVALTPSAGDATATTIEAEANYKRPSRKRRKDKLLETIDELTRDNKCLKMEIEKIYLCVLEQKVTNLQLKSRIHNCVGLGREFVRNSPGDDEADCRDQPDISRVNLQPLIAYPTVHSGRLSTGASCAYPYVRSQGGDVGREGPLDMSVARSMAFTLARQKRTEIRRRSKNNSHSSSSSSSQSQKLIFAGR